MRPAERLLLLFEEEVCLIGGQATEVCPNREVEPHLSGRVQTRQTEGQQLAVGTQLAVCEGARARKFKKHNLKMPSETSYPSLSSKIDTVPQFSLVSEKSRYYRNRK